MIMTEAQQQFLDKAAKLIQEKTVELNQVLKVDDKTKVVMIADAARFVALLTKRFFESDVKDTTRIAQHLTDQNRSLIEGFFPNSANSASVNEEIDMEPLMRGLIKDKKEFEKVKRVFMNTLMEVDASLNPHTSFYLKASALVFAYAVSDGKKADQDAFKKHFTNAVSDYSLIYRKEGKSEAADYIKQVGVALLGILVGLMVSPLLLVSSNARHYVGSFFQGPETTESKKVKAEMGEKLITELHDIPAM
jgi:hypothetical protein